MAVVYHELDVSSAYSTGTPAICGPEQNAAKDHEEMEFASHSSRRGYDRRSEMNARAGDFVHVNAAAFIGARFRNRETVPCEVLEVQAGRVLVRTRFPYRVFSLWVSADWVEGPGRVAELAAG
jgi:hypothetical protein